MCDLRQQDRCRCSVSNGTCSERKRKEIWGCSLQVYLGTPLALEAGGCGYSAVSSAEQDAEVLDLVLGVDVDAEVGGRGGAGGI